jgi:hypothetical protein
MAQSEEPKLDSGNEFPALTLETVGCGSLSLPLSQAEKTNTDQKLEFPVGYGLDGKAATYGAFYDADRGFLHATGFLLRPNGTVVNAVYSTGAVGRLEPASSLGLIDYYQKQTA